MNHDVFISYSRKDRDQAEALCKVLSAAGVKYWIDLSIGGSTNFLTEITRQIKACKTLIFIASAISPRVSKVVGALPIKLEISVLV